MKILSLTTSIIAILIISCVSPRPTGSGLRFNVAYSPKAQNVKIEKDVPRSEVTDILKKAEIIDESKGKVNVSSADILVSDDKIEIRGKNQTTVFNYSDLPKYTIELRRVFFPNVKVKPNSSGTYVLWARVNGKLTEVVYKPFLIEFSNLISFNFGANNFDEAQKLTNHFQFQQNIAIQKQNNAQLSQFEQLAVKYRALKVKPPVSEEQRKFIVQANAFNQEKNYPKAIELYTKAIELDQTAYPGAYMNLALLSAQVSKYDAAIFNMKKYLLLEPESKDARSAQDKIYEWEVKLVK